MVVSCYTFVFEHLGNYFVFNSLSKAFLEVGIDIYNAILEAKKQNTPFNMQVLNADVLDWFKNKRIICDSVEEERKLCREIIIGNRNIDAFRHITIAPTLDCCFSCFYCFEKGQRKKKYIDSETIDAIVKYLQKQDTMQSIHITWFGGEPLMAIYQIKEFYDKFRLNYSGKYSSDMITTAYHINLEVINILKSIELSEVQITLDGLETTHNLTKRTKDCTNVYKRIISNIDLLIAEMPELNVVIRVNITKNNAHEFVELFQELSVRYSNKHVSIVPGYVVNSGNMHLCNLFDTKECGIHSLELWNKHRIPTPWILYNDKTECAIRNPYSIVFDSEGFTYKCWEKLGDVNFRCGKVTSEGNITILNKEVLDDALYGEDPLHDENCIQCSYLPMCFGGCPSRRCETNNKINLCTSHKDMIKEWLTAYYDWKNSK